MRVQNRKRDPVRVVVADDNLQMREKVVQLLGPDFEVVGTAEDGLGAYEAVLLLKPDIVVLDISMPKMSGIESAKALKKCGSPTQIIFLTVHDDPDFVHAALDVGASAYVVKSDMATDLNCAMRAAVNGTLFVSPRCTL